MQTLLIHKENYLVPESYDEIPLSLAKRLYEVPIPPKLLKYYEFSIKKDSEAIDKLKIDFEDTERHFPNFMETF